MKGIVDMFNFILETATTDVNPLASLMPIIGIVLLIVFFYFFMIRPQRKQEKKDAEMRDALQVGDEVTTIGGIIGKVVSIKEETFVLETTKDRTRIRFLRGAIRSVDVKIADVVAAQKAEEAEVAAEESKPESESDKK